MVYATNAVDSVHSRLRSLIKTGGHFPGDYAASKLIWLALRTGRYRSFTDACPETCPGLRWACAKCR